MEEYKPNSHRSKREQQAQELPVEKKVEKIVQGTVKTKKKGEMQKVADIFISEDAKNVKSFVIHDVIVPTIKKTILSTLDMILNGGSGNYNKRSTADRVSYRNYYDRRDDERRPADGARRTAYSYDTVVIDTRGEAEEVLDRMGELIETYGDVSVADLYDLVGVTGSWTDNQYGWNDIRTAEITRVLGGGYTLKLPRAVPLKK